MTRSCSRPAGNVLRHVKEALLVVLVVALAAAAAQRNGVWRTLLSMWTDCEAKSPLKSRTHNNLGNCYSLLDRHFPAIAEYQKAVALEKGNMEAHYNLAVQLDMVGLYTQALPQYEVFCRFASAEFAEQKTYACGRLRELLRGATPPAQGAGRP